jgi:predicted nucleic acid-binding protein
MILVDSSVVIDFTRGKEPKLQVLFSVLNLAVCGIVRAEVLAGSRSVTDRNKLITILNGLVQVPIPEPLWDTVGRNLEDLRTNGVTVPFADVVLATLAIENKAELWTRDAHFQMVRTILPALDLFQEPP